MVREVEDAHDETARGGEIPRNVCCEERVRIMASLVKCVDDVVGEGAEAEVDVADDVNGRSEEPLEEDAEVVEEKC